MNENNKTEAGNENNPQPAIMINTQYIKDLSLEIPFAPEIFRELTEAPHVDIHVDVDAQHMHDNYFNVNLPVVPVCAQCGYQLFGRRRIASLYD